jgi:hypothetical protein
MPVPISRLVVLGAALAVAATACSTDDDCSLNGVCTAGACVCDAGWTSADCSALDLLPAGQSSGLHIANTSSWGGSVAPLASSYANSGEVHLFASLFVNCGLTSWIHNSLIVHASSQQGLSGTFSVENVSIPVWAHNTVFLNVSSESEGPGYLIFHIGDGKEGPTYMQQCSPDAQATPNGTSQCGLLWFPCAAPPTCDDMPAVDGYECVTYACSGDDGWSVSVGAEGGRVGDDVDCGATVADVHLNCTGPEECAFEAAGACAATQGCNSFAVSDFLSNYSWAKLFSSGEQGLRPNAQWNTYVAASASSKGGEEVGASRSWPAPAPARVPAAPAAPAAPAVSGGSTFPVSFSTSLSGPWTTVFANTSTQTNGNNPAPYIAANGSVYVVFNDGHMSMFRSDSGWQGPYTLVTTNTCGGGEDPFIWSDARGNWHCLYHRAPFSDPANQAIGHAFSRDGFSWTASPTAAATSRIQYTAADGGAPLNVTFGKRERPHLVFDSSTGSPIAFVSAVGINPACDPFVFSGPGGAPVIDTARLALINSGGVPHCDAWTQYQRLDLNPEPAYYDRSWTHVQLLGGGSAR